MAENQQKFSAFPSFNATKEEKAKTSYGLEYATAIWSYHTQNIAVYNTLRERYILNRQYAEGLESINKYKDRLDLNGDTSYLNLDFSPVNRIATIVDNIVGRLMDKPYKIQCNPIDPESKTKFDEHRKKMYAEMFLKKYSDMMEEKIGVPLVDKNKSIPETNEEAELELKLKYKPAASIAMEQALKFVFMNNDADVVRRRLIRDMVVLKKAATLRFYDENKNIRYEYVDPVDLITPYSKYDDFKNIPYVGITKQYTIYELSQLNPEFTEKDLFEIARSQAGKNNNPLWTWSQSYEGYYNNLGSTRPYYNFNITVLQFYFITINKDVRVKKKNSKGGFFYESRKDNYTGIVLPESIEVTQDDTKWFLKGAKGEKNSQFQVGKAVAKTEKDAKEYFAKIKNDKRNAVAETITKEVEYLYEGMYIPNTKWCFNYGMVKNIPREKIAGSYSPKVELPVVIIAPDIYDMQNKSLVERLIPHEDQINLIKLKAQQLLIKAKPPGVAIDLEGMDSIVMGMGENKNAAMDGIEVTKMYEQTGSYTFRSRDKNGNVINSSVITPLENGIGRDYAVLFSAYNQELQMMNDVIGYNTAVDASSPDSNAGIGVNKMAIQATNNALRPTYDAVMNVILRQAKRLALMVQDSIEFNFEAFSMAIGQYATETIEYGRELAMNQFAIDIEFMPDDEERMQVEGYIALGLEGGTLTVSDAIRVRAVLKEDVKLAAQLLALLEEKNRKNKMAESLKLQEQNAMVQSQAAQQAAQANVQSQQAILRFETEKLKVEYALKAEFEKKMFEQEMALQQLKNEGAYTVAEINTGGKVEVQHAANEGKVIAQQVANEGKKETKEMEHSSKMFQSIYDKSTAEKK